MYEAPKRSTPGASLNPFNLFISETNSPDRCSECESKYLQVELQAMSPLLQDLGNPVSHMLRGDLGWLYGLLQLEGFKSVTQMCTVASKLCAQLNYFAQKKTNGKSDLSLTEFLSDAVSTLSFNERKIRRPSTYPLSPNKFTFAEDFAQKC